MVEHFDFMSHKLAVGDTVVFILPNYRELVKGTVTRFTECFVFIDYKHPRYTSMTTIKQTGEQLVKVAA